MEMQSLIDQGRLITVPNPIQSQTSANNSASGAMNGQVKVEKPEKLYVIKVEPQRNTHKSVCVEVEQNNRTMIGNASGQNVTGHKAESKQPKLEQKTKIKQEPPTGDVRIETTAVPPAAQRIGRANCKIGVGSKRSSSGNVKNVNVRASQRRLPKCYEPTRIKSHWDFLLDEMSWMATDFFQETKWKQAAAKHFAYACAAAIRRREAAARDDENWRRRAAYNVAAAVRHWWSNLKTLSQYQIILRNKKSDQKRLNLRPVTPDNSDECVDSRSELAQLIDDQRKPIHMLCDIERLYPDKTKKSDISKLPDTLIKEAELLKQRCLELTEVKNIEHTCSLNLSLYQMQGVRWLIDSRKYSYPCHLADEKGLAKRTQVIVYLQNISSCSLLIVRRRDLYHWLSIIHRHCPDFVYTVHTGAEPQPNTEQQLIITTYAVAVQSAYLLSSNWNSLIFDHPPSIKDFDQKDLSTLRQIRAEHRIVVSHTKTAAVCEPKSDAFLSMLLFPERAVSSKQLNSFTLSRTLNAIPEQDRPRKINFTTEKCALSRRQQLVYDELLNASKEELDSQDIDRVMAVVKKLLRVCNHADFRDNLKTQQQINIDPIGLQKFPKLVKNAVVQLQTEWFFQVLNNASKGMSWVVDQQNAICEEKYLDQVQKTQNLLIAVPNFANQANSVKLEPDTTPKILKIQARIFWRLILTLFLYKLNFKFERDF